MSEITNFVKLADKAGYSTAAAIKYTPTGTGAVETTVKARLDTFVSDIPLVSSLPCYGAVSVNATRTTINRHGFEDTSDLNTTDTGLGYSAFDAYAKMTNPLNQDHFHGYQSRSIYNGAGTLNNMYGYWAAPSHTGAGNISNYIGARIADISGTGPVSSSYGVYIDPITRGGSNNYAIWANGGKVHAVDNIETDGMVKATNGFSAGLPVAVGISSKTITTENYINSYYTGTLTLTLPSAATYPGRRIVVKTTTNNAVISASSNVYPLATNVLGTAIVSATAGKWAELISDGATWTTMSAN